MEKIIITNDTMHLLECMVIDDTKENTLGHIDNIIEALVLNSALKDFDISDSVIVLFDIKRLLNSLEFKV
jgi:hypothetical protein